MLKVEKTSWLNRKLNDDKSSKWILVSPLILVLIVFMLYPTFILFICPSRLYYEGIT